MAKPAKSKQAKRKYKQKYKSKYKNKANQMSIRKFPFPKEFYCMLKYSTSIELASTTGSLATHIFRATSLYDPDYTSITGGQPRYFDTLCNTNGTAAPYRRYRVMGSKITARFIATSASYTTGMANIVLGCMNEDKSSPSSIIEARERKDCIVKVLGSAYSNKGIQVMTFRCSPKKVLGIKDLKDNIDTSASYDGNPQEGIHFFLQEQPVDAASSNTVVVEVLIEYLCQFFHMSDVADS